MSDGTHLFECCLSAGDAGVLDDSAQYLGGQFPVTKHLPQSHPITPHVTLSGEPQVMKTLWSIPAHDRTYNNTSWSPYEHINMISIQADKKPVEVISNPY